MITNIKFIELNSPRASRGKPAARFEVTDSGQCSFVWMSKADIYKNLGEFDGFDDGFVKGIKAYNIFCGGGI